MSEEWAVFLRRMRRARGWTQARLSEETAKHMPNRRAISPAWISAMERNQSHPASGAEANPGELVTEAIASALGIDVDEAREKAGYRRKAPLVAASGSAVTLIIPPRGDVTVVGANGSAMQAPREMFEGVAVQARGLLVSDSGEKKIHP